MPCICGGFKDGKPRDLWCRLVDYIQPLVLRRFRQLRLARLAWKRENHATLAQFLKAAMRSTSNRRRYRTQEDAAQRSCFALYTLRIRPVGW